MRHLFRYSIYFFALVGLFLSCGYVAIRLGLTKTGGLVDEQRKHFVATASNIDSWSQTLEWKTLKIAILKDRDDIEKAARIAGVSSRLVVAPLVVEQLRLFTSDREVFKQVFAPLTILGVQSQYSWGVMGLKQEAAKKIEENLVSTTSPYYLGPEMAQLLDFTTKDHDTARFQRLTDDKSRYYSYLYTALYEQQLLHQWKNAGFDISDRPEILGTLFNIGFEHSLPNATPQSGGAEIDIGGSKYSFGALAADFYYSTELPEFVK